MTNKLSEVLDKMGSCRESVEWTKGLSLEEAWNTCGDPEWMLWAAARLLPRQFVAIALLECFKQTKDYEYYTEPRLHTLIDETITLFQFDLKIRKGFLARWQKEINFHTNFKRIPECEHIIYNRAHYTIARVLGLLFDSIFEGQIRFVPLAVYYLQKEDSPDKMLSIIRATITVADLERNTLLMPEHPFITRIKRWLNGTG